MNIDINFDRIEAYLFGAMPAADRQIMEAEMAENAQLAASVELHRLEHRAMELSAQQDLRAQFSAWNDEKQAENATETAAAKGEGRVVALGGASSRRTWMRYAIAASVTLMVGFFAKSIFFPGMSDGELAGSFFDETSLAVRGGGGQIPAELTAATAAMAQKDYPKAASLLAQVTDSTYLIKSRLLLGECWFRSGDFQGAGAMFNEVIKDGQSRANREQAEWFLVLTQLAKGDEKSAFEAGLQKILADPNHAFYSKAEALRRKK